ncbi:MAG: response regulator [Deltaproteobacteria bacterium]|nr:response regulator [Deltaproteobacteria bacterium]
MTQADDDDGASTVWVLSVKPRDAQLTCATLQDVGLKAACTASFAELVETLEGPIGALMLTADAVPSAGWQELSKILARQPAWSDLPVIVFSRERQGGLEELLASGTSSITVIETPVRVSTVISAAKAAMRARRRQYEVRDLVERLEEADRRKDEFLAMLGHELRNPLGAMQLALQVQQMQSPAAEPNRHMAVMERQLKNLGRIVDDLLDVSRVTLGKIQLEVADVDLCEAARRCVQAITRDAENSRLRLTLAVPSEPVWTKGDPVRIEQVLSNLVTNAIKYTPAGGAIAVEVTEPERGRARITVSDSGIGIDPAIVESLFELFMQARQGLDRSRGGLGLGLALVKRLVELHGGTVGAHSDGPGRGAKFWIELPVEDRRPTDQFDVVMPEQRPLKLLLVEDNADAREMLRELLTRDGHDVSTANDGIAGLEAARTLEPDLMLVDIGLPGISGHDLAREIRRTSERQPWMIAMTGYGQPTDRERALDAGFDLFVVKPVSIPDLRQALAQCAESLRFKA